MANEVKVYGMTEKGFIPKRQADILEEMTNEFMAIQDNRTGEFPFLNITDDSILGQSLAILSSEFAVCWAAAEDAFKQFDPLQNTGAGQSATVQLNGLERKPGSKTIVSITCTGSAGAYVPQGSLISNLDGTLLFEVDATIPLDANGNGIGTASNTELGNVTVPVNSLNFIKTNTPGWTGVTNTQTVQQGTPEESDSELRIRQQQSTTNTAYRQAKAIEEAIEQVNGVRTCHLYVNPDETTDLRGLPSKQISAVVVGGDDKDIATQISIKAPLGIQGYGNTNVTLYDDNEFPYVIKFTRPAQVGILVDIHIEVTNPAEFSPNYEEEIKEAIIAYAQYDSSGNGFPPGINVYVSRLYTPINEQEGFKVNSLQIAREDSPSEWTDDYIEIYWDEVADFTADNITITQDIPNS